MIIIYLPLLLTIISGISLYYAGQKKVISWQIGILCQIMWLYWNIISKNYNLIPMTIMMIIINVKNLILWKKQ